ncbi:MAG: isopeptide-forming domain-containing fimbrial protein [Clostridia bacterium]|nr:isopeptide-forming domain-containing fimbrial protein [Clostridia bacterium]
MRKIKVLVALVLVAMMSLALVGSAMAVNGTITINKAAVGEKYAVYKVLDATINSNGGIDYTGTIPAEFANILVATTVGTAPNTYSAIGLKDPAPTQDAINAALKAYVARLESAASYDAVIEAKSFANATSSQTASANTVSFSVAPGFYVVVSSQGTTVMADSATNPATAITEKNTTTVTGSKTVEHESYSIGDTVKYTGTFSTANYVDGKPVVHYVISDTLPPFLSNPTITSVTVGGVALDPIPSFTNKAFSIEWATWDATNSVWVSKYSNGSVIVVNYEATLTSTTNIGKDDTNTISIKPQLGKDDGTEDEPTEKNWNWDETIKTYAAALKKTDGTNGIPGAEFTVAGLVAHEKELGSGIWIVDSLASTNTTPTTLTTDNNGMLYIVGIASNATLTATETKAPDGYNKLNESKIIPVQLMDVTTYKTASWEKYDAKGNLIDSKTTEDSSYTQVTKSLADLDATAFVVVNNKGTELPSTGGIGTTIFYIVGAVLVLGAAAVILARRKAEQQ